MFLLVAKNSRKNLKADSLEISSLTSSAVAAIDIDIEEEEGEEESEEKSRVTIQRRAKSIAKEAITSILLPHYNCSDSKIDQINYNSRQKESNQQNSASAFDSSNENKNNRDHSLSSKRRRSKSSTFKDTSETTATTSHNLRSSRKSSSTTVEESLNLPSTSRRLTRKSSSLKAVPNKKAKLNSDINNNLNSKMIKKN